MRRLHLAFLALPLLLLPALAMAIVIPDTGLCPQATLQPKSKAYIDPKFGLIDYSFLYSYSNSAYDTIPQTFSHIWVGAFGEAKSKGMVAEEIKKTSADSSDGLQIVKLDKLFVKDESEGCYCFDVVGIEKCICNGPWANWWIEIYPLSNNSKCDTLNGVMKLICQNQTFVNKNYIPPSYYWTTTWNKPVFTPDSHIRIAHASGPTLTISGDSCEWYEVGSMLTAANGQQYKVGPQFVDYDNFIIWDWDNWCYPKLGYAYSPDGGSCADALWVTFREGDEGMDDDYILADIYIKKGIPTEKESSYAKAWFQNEYGVSAPPDSDKDGLSDSDEGKWGTNPKKSDTDGDGVSDGAEINQYKTDPTKASADADGDGIKDSDEILKYFSSPTNSDTDGDGLSDPEEINKYKTSPTAMDTDGDGKSDADEIKKGTDPKCFNPKLGSPIPPPLTGCPAYGPLQPNIGKMMDLDGDGRGDLISFSKDHKWYIDLSSVGPTQFFGTPFPKGQSKDNFGTWNLVFDLSKDASIAKDAMLFPVVMDYNTDGKADLALYDTVHGRWYVHFTTGNTLNTNNMINYTNNPWPGWDMVVDYSTQPHWKAFSRPVPLDSQDNDPTTFDHYMNMALQTPDGWWLIDYGGKDKDSYGTFDETIKYLVDAQLSEAPAWAWLPAVYLSSYNNDQPTGTRIIVKSPDGITNPTSPNRILTWDTNSQTLSKIGDIDYGSNAGIIMQGKFQTKSHTDLGIKQSNPTYGEWLVATNQSDWSDLININAYQNFGDAHCIPIPADYDGDDYDDRAVQCGDTWKIDYTGSKFPTNSNKQTTIILDGKQVTMYEISRTINLQKTKDPLPGYVYPGGVSYQKLYDMYKNYNFLCILGSGLPKFTCDITNVIPPISPYLPQCISDGKDLLTCLMP